MITQLNDIAQIWWQWMGSMFWQVSLLIVIVTLLDMFLRKLAWPQVRYTLWALVFIKLIIPPTWEMPTGIVSWLQPQVDKQISVQIGTTDEAVAGGNILLPESNGNTAVEQVTWKTWLLSGWTSGMFIFSLLLIRKMMQFRRWRKTQIKGDVFEWHNELMLKIAAKLKLEKIPAVLFSREIKSPAVYGVIKQYLVLPEGYMEKLSKEQAEHVLIHELCHLKRGDLLVHWFCIALQIVYWFNPLLIWSRRQMRHVCEICCDLSVANVLREKTAAYRETLIRTARELFAESLEPSLGFLGIFEEPYRLVPRLRWLEKRSWENRKRRIAVTACAVLFMISCVMPMSTASHSENQNNDSIQFIRPLTGSISSGYGDRISPITNEKEIHNGIDIVARSGEPIHAAASGTVREVGFAADGYGHYIILQHKNNFQTLYAKCDKINVKEGQFVKQGDIIATCGNSVRSTGPHLHFELRKDGESVNPIEIYPENKVVQKTEAKIEHIPGDDDISVQNTSVKPKLVQMDFDNADIKHLIKFISDLTGKNFIVDPDIKGKVTIMAPIKLTVDEAYEIFEDVLEVNGYKTVTSGKAIKIVKAVPDN